MRKGWMRHLDFMVVDWIALLCAWLCAGFLYEAFDWATGNYLNLGIMLLMIQILVVFLTEGYNGIVYRGYLKELYAVIKVIALSFSALIVIWYVTQNKESISSDVLILIMNVDLLLMYLGRITWKKCLRERYRKMAYTRQIFVITTKNEAEKMIHKMLEKSIRNYTVSALAILDADMKGQSIEGIPVNTNSEELVSYVKDRVIDEVFINLPGDFKREHKLARMFLDMGTTVHIYMQQHYEDFPNRGTGNVFGYDVLTTSISAISFRQLLLKRLMDIAGGLVGVILTGILFIFVAPAIWVKSPGPVFFSQVRVGKSGRRFRIHKFRSMYMDAEERKKELMAQNEGSELMFKMKNDPRVIKGIGGFIRKTSIDEMPQFWNVLKGDMSLVGTRPPTEAEYEQYEWHHKKRLSIKPGITGLWQISGRSDIKDFEEVVRLDTEYIENYSLELDVKILVKTVLTVIKGSGAS